MPANMIYNFGAAILRAVGDTRRPLMYLTIAGVANVLLNILFVAGLGMGVSGVAWATIAAQVISAILVVLCLMRTEGSIHLDLKQLRLRADKVLEIARIGLPAGLQGIFFSFSNVIIQATVNSFGTVATAGNTAASNIEGYIYVSMNAIYQAAITFVSQNVGAYRYDRISRVTRAALLAVTGIGLGMGAILFFFMRAFFTIYTDDPAVIAAASIRSSVIAPTYFLCGMMDTMVGVLRGMGSSVAPMIVSVMGACVFRLLWIALIYPFNPTLNMLYLSYPISWLITLSVHLMCYFHLKRKKYSVQ
jgi:putative MATE family efflux protein